MIFMNDGHQTLVMFMILLDDWENYKCEEEKRRLLYTFFCDDLYVNVNHLGDMVISIHNNQFLTWHCFPDNVIEPALEENYFQWL